MSRIIFQKTYIIILPSFAFTDTHKHPFLHLFCSDAACRIQAENQIIQGSCILTAPNVRHAIPAGNGIAFFLLIDPTSRLAEDMQSRYLQSRPIVSLRHTGHPSAKDLNSLPDEQIVQVVENMLAALRLSSAPESAADERIQQVTDRIISGEWLDCSVKEIAANMYLSESRLTHLFKETVGISLKSYIVIRRLESAYRCIVARGGITRAAHESGFSSSAHLAYTCKKLTGISVSDVLKDRKTADS